MFSHEEIAARVEICDLMNRYAVFMDENEREKFSRLFTDDATFDIARNPGIAGLPARGRDTIVEALFTRRAAVADKLQRRHVISNTIFDELNGDFARTRTFVTVLSVPRDGGPAVLSGTGVYHDRLERRETRWLIAERVFHVDVLK